MPRAKRSVLLETPSVPAAPLLDQVLAATAERQAAARSDPVPAGFRLLPAGPVYRVRVNRDYIVDGEAKPFLVQADDDEPEEYAAVRLLGPCALCCSETEDGCDSHRSAWVETTGALLVK